MASSRAPWIGTIICRAADSWRPIRNACQQNSGAWRRRRTCSTATAAPPFWRLYGTPAHSVIGFSWRRTCEGTMCMRLSRLRFGRSQCWTLSNHTQAAAWTAWDAMGQTAGAGRGMGARDGCGRTGVCGRRFGTLSSSREYPWPCSSPITFDRTTPGPWAVGPLPAGRGSESGFVYGSPAHALAGPLGGGRYNRVVSAGWAVAPLRGRKVRSPQGSVPANGRGDSLKANSTESATENIPPGAGFGGG